MGAASARSSRAIIRMRWVWAVASAIVRERVAREKSENRSRRVTVRRTRPRRAQPAGNAIDKGDERSVHVGQRLRRAPERTLRADRAPPGPPRTGAGRGCGPAHGAGGPLPARGSRPAAPRRGARRRRTVVIPRAWSSLGRDPADAPEPLDRQRVQEAQLGAGGNDEQTVGLGHRAGDLGQELRCRQANRDRPAPPRPEPHDGAARRSRAGYPGCARARARRETPHRSTRPSTTGDGASKIVKTALLASV